MAIKPVQTLVSSSKYNIKCPYTMSATRIVVHNTANDASARNEVSYMINNNAECSYHFAIDDKEVVQGIPLNRNAWHAGDGAGAGNMKGIGIEICYSKSGGSKFIAAEKLAAKFIAQLLKERGWGIGKVTKHQDYSGKYCPHRTLDMGWQRFLNMVKAELNETTSNATTSTSSLSTSAKATTPDVIYNVKTQKHGWLGEVKNLTDYAGWQDSPIVAVAMKATSGVIKYRVHVKGGSWLGWITKYNIKDSATGYAGNGKPIDAIQVVYEGGRVAKYRVAPVGGNYYDWQKDTQKTNGQDGYAGCFGRSIGKLQVDIV